MLDDRPIEIQQVPSTLEYRSIPEHICVDGKRWAVISLSNDRCQSASGSSLLHYTSQCSSTLDESPSIEEYAVQYPEDSSELFKRQQQAEQSGESSPWKIAVIASLCSVLATLLLLVIGFKLAKRSKRSRQWLRMVSAQVSPELPNAKDDPAWNVDLKHNHSSRSLLSFHSKGRWVRRRSAPAHYGDDGEEIVAATKRPTYGIGNEVEQPLPETIDDLPVTGLGLAMYDHGSIPLQRSATWAGPGLHVSFSQETHFPDYSPDHPNYLGKLPLQYARPSLSRHSTRSSSVSPPPQAYSFSSHTSHTVSSFSPNVLNSSLASLASSVQPSTYKLPPRRLDEADSISDSREVLQSEMDDESVQLARTPSNGSTVYESCANSISNGQQGHTSTPSSSTFATAASPRSSTDIPAVFIPNRRSSLINTRRSSLPTSPAEALRRTSISHPHQLVAPPVPEEAEIIQAEPAIPKRMSSAADGQTHETARSLHRYPSIISMPRMNLYVANGRATPDQSEVGSMLGKNEV